MPCRAVLIIPPRSELQRLVQVSVLSVGILNLESGLRSFKRRNVAPVLSEREDARLSVGGVKKTNKRGLRLASVLQTSYLFFSLRDILLSSDNIHSEARPCACLSLPPTPSKKKKKRKLEMFLTCLTTPPGFISGETVAFFSFLFFLAGI